MKVLLPSPLASYTANRREVEAAGATLDELLRDLDRRYPGIRFRVIDEQDAIRPHIKIFVNREQASALRSHLKSGARNSRRRRRPFPNPDATHGHAIHAIAELRSFAGATPGGLNRPHARGRNSWDAAHSKAPLQGPIRNAVVPKW